MKLGYHTGYWSSGPPPGVTDAIAVCEQVGFDSIWTAEAYGSDCLTPLAWWGAATERVRLGTDVMQMSARTPTATAMAALTLDHLSGGRFVLGLGASGPQVVEGWYGQPYPKPLARTREYIEIVRKVLGARRPGHQRRAGLSAALSGRHRAGQGAQVDGAPAAQRHPDHARRRRTEERRARRRDRRRLAADVLLAEDRRLLPRRARRGLRPRRARGTPRTTSRSPRSCRSSSTTTLEAAADRMRPSLALYIGGMGAKTMNFHADVFARMGYEAEVAKIQELYPRRPQGRGDRRRADRARRGRRPGRPGREDRATSSRAWRETVITTLLVQTDPRLLATIAELIGCSRLTASAEFARSSCFKRPSHGKARTIRGTVSGPPVAGQSSVSFTPAGREPTRRRAPHRSAPRTCRNSGSRSPKACKLRRMPAPGLRSGCPPLPAHVVEDTLLLVSELVTNAVRHGGPDIVLSLAITPTGSGSRSATAATACRCVAGRATVHRSAHRTRAADRRRDGARLGRRAKRPGRRQDGVGRNGRRGVRRYLTSDRKFPELRLRTTAFGE